MTSSKIQLLGANVLKLHEIPVGLPSLALIFLPSFGQTEVSGVSIASQSSAFWGGRLCIKMVLCSISKEAR